jgi:hypothetical protein
VGAVGAAAWLALACNEPDRHVLLGQRYDVPGNCLEPTSSIDIVVGSDPGDCSPATCVVTPGGVVYATNMCGPYPSLDDTSGTAVECTGALAALTNGTLCGSASGDDASPPEGGEAAPPSDAGGPGDGSPPDGSAAADATPPSEGGD